MLLPASFMREGCGSSQQPEMPLKYHRWSIAALEKEISRRTNGKLDILVNNAGRNYTVPALDIDLKEVREMYESNVFAVMRMCQVFAPLLIEAKGMIVQIGSLAGLMSVDPCS